jgi:histidyl-tRNA synthetase
MKFQKPKGTKDILPSDMNKWHFVENVIRKQMDLFNFKEIRTPTFESTNLFARGVGTETDIVGKEMYTFEDKGGHSITLKPEMTAPVARAYIENGMAAEAPVHKLFYISSMFRYEKPQEGRYREHTQFGAEIIGTDNIYSDIEIILLAKSVYSSVGLTNFKVKINSIGRFDERKRYIEILKEYLNENLTRLSTDSQRRFVINPLRILDSKDTRDREITDNAPKIIDHLESTSRERFEKVLAGLDNLNIKYELDFRLVRGLDYYTDTTFEFVSQDLGSQDAIGGGGRYDGLVETIGGKPSPGIGFGSGVERIIIAAERNNFLFPDEPKPKVFFISLTEEAKQIAFNETMGLRSAGIKAEYDSIGRSFKAQMREANKTGAEYVIIIGEDEIKKGVVILKNMSDSSQTEILINNIKESLK